MGKRKFPNGFGGITKLSGKRTKPFMIYKTSGFNELGKQIKVPLGYYETYEDAFGALRDYNKGKYNLDYSNIKTKEVFDLWYQEKEKMVQKGKMNKHSLDLYYNAFYNHAKTLFKTKFTEIRTNDIQDIIEASGLKYTSKRYIKGVFNYMFQYALKNDIPVNRNYAEFVTIDDEQASNKHKRIPEKELEIILSHQSDPGADIVLTLIYTGMRANECIKITRENINIEEHYMIGGSKTEAGKNRIIPIHPRIETVLNKRYNECSYYLFERNGKKYTYDTLRTDFDKFMENLGFDYTPHDCRYTFATRAKEAHLNDNAIKKILGHTIKDVTDGIYVQWSSQLLYEEIIKIK